MSKKLIILISVFAVLALVTAEVFYFRFHTYFQNTRIEESLPVATQKTLEVESAESSESIMEPKSIVKGNFVAVDFVHKGSGTAQIIEQDGKRYLSLESFEVTNGPDLYIYLSDSKNPGNSIESLDNYVSLGMLKGNQGNQVYEIPESYKGNNTAIIWCKKFGVLFSYAVMQ